MRLVKGTQPQSLCSVFGFFGLDVRSSGSEHRNETRLILFDRSSLKC